MKKLSLIILLLISVFHLTTVYAFFDDDVITQNGVNDIIDSEQVNIDDVKQGVFLKRIVSRKKQVVSRLGEI